MADCLQVFVFGHRFRQTWIAGLPREVRQDARVNHLRRDLDSVRFQSRHRFFQVARIPETQTVLQIDGLQSLLRCLLGMEAKVLIECADRKRCASERQLPLCPGDSALHQPWCARLLIVCCPADTPARCVPASTSIVSAFGGRNRVQTRWSLWTIMMSEARVLSRDPGSRWARVGVLGAHQLACGEGNGQATRTGLFR